MLSLCSRRILRTHHAQRPLRPLTHPSPVLRMDQCRRRRGTSPARLRHALPPMRRNLLLHSVFRFRERHLRPRSPALPPLRQMHQLRPDTTLLRPRNTPSRVLLRRCPVQTQEAVIPAAQAAVPTIVPAVARRIRMTAQPWTVPHLLSTIRVTIPALPHAAAFRRSKSCRLTKIALMKI